MTRAAGNNERFALAALTWIPDPIVREQAAWVTVVRGQGRVDHPALTFKTIRNYLSVMMPVLSEWAVRYGSLREVTRNDILDAVAARHGPVTQRRMVALRSVFRALRQERVVLRDPTQSTSSVPSASQTPPP